MHAMAVEFTMPEGTDFDALRQLMKQRASLYEGMPGLHFKAFVLDPERRAYGGLYVWDSREHIDEFLKSEIFQGIVQKFGQPQIRMYEVATLVERGASVGATR
jgi:heme-degrading monooxygenase HmoA